MTNKKYHKRNEKEIIDTARRFDAYHTMFRDFVADNPGVIKSSLDRGTISYPKEMYSDREFEMLGSRRSTRSFSYGPEEGDNKVREMIAEVENLRHKTHYSSDNVAIMPGAWAGLEFTLQEVLKFRKGRTQGKVAVIGPTLYQMFYTPIEHFGMNMEAYDFVNPKLAHVPDLEDLDKILEGKPEVIVISNSNNPDGVYFKPNVLEEMVKKAEENGFFVVIDEIQNCFPTEGNGLNYGSWIQSPNVIRLDSPSKRYALSDCRVGWVIADPKLLYGHINGEVHTNRIEGIVGRMSGVIGNAPRVANNLLLYLLDKEKDQILTGDDSFRDYKQRLLDKKNYVVERLKNIPRVKRIYLPESCVNVTAQIDYSGTDMDLSRNLMERGTLVMPASGYGYNPEDSILRFTFAERFETPEKPEKIGHCLDIVENFLSR